MEEDNTAIYDLRNKIILDREYEIYEIRKGDTVQSLANFFKISKDYLIGFHNIRSKETILLELPSNLKQLYVDPRLEEIANNHKTRTKLQLGQILVLEPSRETLNYGVTYDITENNETTEIKFEISVQFIKKIEQTFIFEVNRSKEIYVNSEKANSMLDELASQSSEAIYPLEIVTNLTGGGIDINNYDHILKRWKQKRKQLEKYYEGDWFKNYLDQMEQTLQNKNHFLEKIRNDWFLNAYFKGIYANYYKRGKALNLVTPKSFSFPIIPNCNPVLFEGELQIEKYLDEYNIVQIEYTGQLTDQRSKQDLINAFNTPYYSTTEGAQLANGNLTTKYFLDSNNTIETIYLHCEIELKTIKTVSVVVSVIN